MRTQVHIDRLVLHGIAEHEAGAVAAAVRERLAALIANAPVTWTSAGRVDAGQFTVGASASETGAHVATAVHNGLTKGRHT